MTSAAPLLIRPMTLDDCDAVAEVRVRGWQFAYAGLMPQTYLDAMSVARDAARRREVFGRGGDLVAERSGSVIGWACHGPSRDRDLPPGEAELYAPRSAGLPGSGFSPLTHR
ncbi:N-acetyltransferase family protein [Streptomyces sp. KL116D]|uniref:GNAT family N-acetyltransferase n=1 Tax=Streptomyces sp. KL116D TaxID=3045152 RepID=UPI0035590C3A